MALFTYNNVTLPLTHFTQFDQSVEYDDSNTDRLYSRFDISLQTLVNPAYVKISAAPGGAVLTNPADIMNVLQTFLEAPRKKLSVLVNGVELIPNTTQPGTCDAKNGPHPGKASIIQMTDTTFLLTYSITAHYWKNNTINAGSSPAVANDQAGSNALSNRWTESVEIDDCNYSTRTRDGTVILRADNWKGVVADQLRTQMAVVGLPRGFMRKSSNYTVDPSGLALRYRVVDFEPFKLPPPPAFKAEGEYGEHYSRFATWRTCEARVKLWGSKATDQKELVKAALAVCMSKIAANVTTTTSSYNIESASLRVGMYENWVEVHQRWRFPATGQSTSVQTPVTQRTLSGRLGAAFIRGVKATGAAQLAAGVFTAGFSNAIVQAAQGGGGNPINVKPTEGGLTMTPGTDDFVANVPAYLSRGTANLLLQTASYYDPSLQSLGLTGPGSPVLTTADNPVVPIATNINMSNAAYGTLPGTAGETRGT